jgi:adenine-specific DNA-methyltransferase
MAQPKSKSKPLIQVERNLISPHDLIDQVEGLRLQASTRLQPDRKIAWGQFLTPAPIACLMASTFNCPDEHIHILDAGAGVGTLFAAFANELISRDKKPSSITVTAVERDETLAAYAAWTLELCEAACLEAGVIFQGEIVITDFLEYTVHCLRGDLFTPVGAQQYTCAIMNPPYRKIQSASHERQLLKQLGIEASNLYTGFLAAAMQLLEPEGELVAITPRSFCNGPYFRAFRMAFLREMALQRIHLFDSRQEAFQGDMVLQENIIITAKKQCEKPESVMISSSAGADGSEIISRPVSYQEVVRPDDPQSFIHIVPSTLDDVVRRRMTSFQSSLDTLGLMVSTGRVVDFRVRPYLRDTPGQDTAPLLYPAHLTDGSIVWPRLDKKKPNALIVSSDTEQQLVPNEHYVLVKRFSAKEERRRVVASVYDATEIDSTTVAFENHLNYFHHHGRGLSIELARGLAAFLNSTIVDLYFRQFNGHTQVNATDLRNMRYPTRMQLEELGTAVSAHVADQELIDSLVGEMTTVVDGDNTDPVQAKRRVEEALSVIQALGFPRAQQNERSALTLLALLALTPAIAWSEASNPLIGISEMMEYFAAHYGKRYAENTRETVRRQTIHQFVDAGLVVANPDDPERAVNSPDFVYQIEASALELLRTFRSEEWPLALAAYLDSRETLQQRYAQERQMVRIPVQISSNKDIALSSGGQNILIKHIIEEFGSRFTPGGSVLYIGDAAGKFAYFESERLENLGIQVEAHGKMPDVLIHHAASNWLIIVEAVTSHGPISPKRRLELQRLFSNSTAGLVFVTAFLTRKVMTKYLSEIAWETEVWVAESPSHLIHFNGDRYLGPYDAN